MIRILLFLVSVFTFNACTVTRQIAPGEDQQLQNDNLTIEAVNDEIGNTQFIVKLVDGREIRAHNGKLSQKYLEFQTETNDNHTEIAIDSIREISYRDHLGGVLDAAFISILPSIIAGIQYDVGGAQHDPAYGRAFATFGSGLLIGFVIQKKHIIEISSDSLPHPGD